MCTKGKHKTQCTGTRKHNNNNNNKRGVVVRARHTEFTASRSELWSLHCLPCTGTKKHNKLQQTRGGGTETQRVATNAGWWYVLATQRSLHPVLSCGLCTARGTYFFLLCCQPVTVRRLSCARTAQLTPRSPCAPQACKRQLISTVCKTCEDLHALPPH